jgi:cytochrome c oxidase cbb3-type subunit 4
MTMDLGVLRGIGTLVLMVSFVALCVWAYSPRRRERFREAARLPLGDDAFGGDR